MKMNSKKQLVVGLVMASAVFVMPALALTSVETDALVSSVAASKVVEVPATVAKLIS